MKRNIILLAASLAVSGLAHAANPHPQMPNIPSAVFNITNYGAVGDGATDDTIPIQNAINAASQAGGGTVEIPAGTFESGPITLYSDINLHLDTNAVLEMLPLGQYPGGTTNAQTFIYCNEVHDLEISGHGIINGQGQAWWDYAANNGSIVRPEMLNLYSCDRLFIHDVTFENPPGHHCGVRHQSGNVTISNLTIDTISPSPNTDGLNFVATNSIIEDCHISDGDDDIAMGAHGPINDLLITNCAFGTGHGVSFGSGIDGVTNVSVVNCTFNNTGNGLRIKCARDNSLPLRNVNYLNLSMTNTQFPIVFYSYYDLTGDPDSIQPSEVLSPTNKLAINDMTPRWSNITISNLTATSTKIGGIIWGPTEWPITNVILSHVNITAPGTFDLYNVYGVKVIDSRFNFASGPTFTLCNAGLIISNSTADSPPVTLGGAASANTLALYNADASMNSTDALACNPITLSGSKLSNTGNLAFSNNQVINFVLGTNTATLVNAGNLQLNGTINISAANGFAPKSYTLFTCSGTLSGLPTLGSMPAGYQCVLNTNIAGQISLVVTHPGTTATTTTLQSSANPSSYGKGVTFTANVSPAPPNGEDVLFEDGSTTLGNGSLNNGQATFTTSAYQLPVGAHSITAIYVGDGTYSSSSSSVLTLTVKGATNFSDTFGASTIDSTIPAAPTPTATSYEVLSDKSWNPTPSITSGHLTFGIGSTSSGVVELQAQFAASPINLINPGDFVRLSVTFTDTAGILNQSGLWAFGLYNSGGVAPVGGGLESTMSTGYSSVATGGAQNWQGYFAQIGITGSDSAFFERERQTGTANNNQDLVTTGTSASCANPRGAQIGNASTTPSVMLTNGDQYTEVLTFSLTSSHTLQLENQLYTGASESGALLSTMTATTGTPLTTAFDALAIGWRATGGTPSVMDVNDITVASQNSTPAIEFTLSASKLNLSWPTNYLGWLLQSNSVGVSASNDWSTVPGSGNSTTNSITINPATTNVFFRLVPP